MLIIGCFTQPALADPQDIEDGEPVTLEDAYTSPPGLLSAQYSTAYVASHDQGRRELVEQGPTLKLGVIQGVQASVNTTYDTGTASGRNAGIVLSDVLVQFNGETRLLPAISLDTFYAVPFGAGPKSAAYVFRAIASKSLGVWPQSPRLHLNLTDYHLTQPDLGGRRDQLEAVFGGSTLITAQAAIVADIVTGGAEKAHQSETFLEVGYSRDLPDDWSLELGVGKQVAGRADAVWVFFSIEKDLQIF